MIEGALATRIEDCPPRATDTEAETLVTDETPGEPLRKCLNEAERTRNGLAWPFFT